MPPTTVRQLRKDMEALRRFVGLSDSGQCTRHCHQERGEFPQWFHCNSSSVSCLPRGSDGCRRRSAEIVTVFLERTLSSLHQLPAEPGEFADDQTVAALEDVHQVVEAAALFGSLYRGGRLDDIVDAESAFACVLKDGEALTAHVLLRGRDPQIGNGFQGLAMGCVTVHATKLFGQNERLFLTEPCRQTRASVLGMWENRRA